jgi:hypothetical protein
MGAGTLGNGGKKQKRVMIKTIEMFIDLVKHRKIEIYNEFSLQHELGIMLRCQLPDWNVQFERNVGFFFPAGKFIKKEIDISIFSPDKSKLRYAIELKYPRNGQYPEQMYSFCKDIQFIEELKQAGFEKAFLVVFADDPLFYSGKGDGIYGHFRKGNTLHGLVSKPTGEKGETLKLSGSYRVQWASVAGSLKYALIEACSGSEN